MRKKAEKSKTEWAATACGRTDEQRLLEHLGIGYSDISTFLPKYYVREGDNLIHRLLIHLGIECREGGFISCEAWFHSIREFVQDKGAKATYFSQHSVGAMRAGGRGYMTRTGLIHTL